MSNNFSNEERMEEQEDFVIQKEIFPNIKPTQLKELRETFALFDKEGEGQVSTVELETLLRSLGINPSKDDVHLILLKFDPGNTGVIHLMDFLEYMGPRIREPDNNTREINDAFKVFDKNGSGEINVKDLLKQMTEIGDKLSVEEAKFILTEAQLDIDAGNINFKNQIQSMMRF